ncbi:UvrD-like helicase, ATP-binding domain, P-loop containing nucleoside triphosphate hydrolase [Tanacetum coccineum]
MGDNNWKFQGYKEDQTQRISKSIFVTNFPEHFTAKDLWNVCIEYGKVIDVFIPFKKSQAGTQHIATTDHTSPDMVLDDSCFSERDVSMSLMGKVKDVTSLPNLYLILEKEGFRELNLTYLGGLWVLIDMDSQDAIEKIKKHTGVGSWFFVLKLACNSFIASKWGDMVEWEISDDDSSLNLQEAAKKFNCTIAEVENTLAKFTWAKEAQRKIEKLKEEGKPMPKNLAEFKLDCGGDSGGSGGEWHWWMAVVGDDGDEGGGGNLILYY